MHVPGAQMAVDGLTKALHGQARRKFSHWPSGDEHQGEPGDQPWDESEANQLVEQHHHLHSPNRIGAGDRGDYIDADAGFFTSATWHVVADLSFWLRNGGREGKTIKSQ